MTRKVVWFDCDGVLLDMYTGFCKKYMPGITPTDFADYNIALYPPFNGDREAMVKAFEEFIETAEHANLPPLATITSLETLKNMGYELHVITQCGGSVTALTNRVWNLAKVFGPVFSGVHFTVFGQSKLDYINQWAADNLSGTDAVVALAEDRPQTVEECAEYVTSKGPQNVSRHIRGIKAVGIKQTYNKSHWDYPRTYWYSGVDAFCFALVYNTIENQKR